MTISLLNLNTSLCFVKGYLGVSTVLIAKVLVTLRPNMRLVVQKYLLILTVSCLASAVAWSQAPPVRPAPSAADSTVLPPDVPRPVYGPYDTITVPAKVYNGELLPA